MLNPAKCEIIVSGTKTSTIEKLGGVEINKEKIQIGKIAKILGFNLSINKFSTKHVSSLINKANHNLHKLLRFKSAPPKIKLHLYKVLIRPILEYPCYPLTLISKSSKRKIQIIQNKALRFVHNIKTKDKVNMKTIHEKYKIPPMNTRLHNLAIKNINNLREQYLCNRDNYIVKPYKFSNYNISTPPIKIKKRTIALRVKKYIYNVKNKHKKQGMLLNINKPENWIDPEPIYHS